MVQSRLNLELKSEMLKAFLISKIIIIYFLKVSIIEKNELYVSCIVSLKKQL